MNSSERWIRPDIIGWIIAVPVSGYALFSIPTLYQCPAAFSRIFDSFNVELPAMTKFYLAIGGPGVCAVLVTLAVVPIVTLLRSKTQWHKIVVPLCAAFLLGIFLQSMSSSLVDPLLGIMDELARNGPPESVHR